MLGEAERTSGRGASMSPMPRVLAATSILFSGLTWLSVLVVYAWSATVTTDALMLLLALAAFVLAVLAVVTRPRSLFAWIALAVGLIFPIWLWKVLSELPSDAF
jgi:hypothetical protein